MENGIIEIKKGFVFTSEWLKNFTPKGREKSIEIL